MYPGNVSICELLACHKNVSWKYFARNWLILFVLFLKIYNEARKFAQGSIIKCCQIYGGTASRAQNTTLNVSEKFFFSSKINILLHHLIPNLFLDFFASQTNFFIILFISHVKYNHLI